MRISFSGKAGWENALSMLGGGSFGGNLDGVLRYGARRGRA